MNRHQRRVVATKGKARPTRAELIRTALNMLATHPDPTVSGCTLFLPDGETLHLDADAARAMAATKPAGGRA
jgi:hypothetical protein